ncbi:hypothetical protein BuS5_03483 [Desulfosarcina sp. BuS5]|uniref:DUF262 domain-containing protein n=1 Tax=Desulfosarcina sp. BuS5 TaxID=933262 RepID=UPI000488EE4E|nr:DUF262 domain-containing protein [Desulfosarcina sp. BuS5]WDN90512.1 hypothetical protein BuS5_03483 [Desulfosarcina sp. BuS5]
MAETADSFKLSDVVEKTINNTISLPTVQRGFVWKPYQIENLWDSLLRGYPVGSFVLSKKNNSQKNYELLDGQQRASAICLGFYSPLNDNKNPVTNNEIFKTSTENIMVFIDLAKPASKNDNRKYLFRVITKSHPWGYRRQENQKTLEAHNIAKAMHYYKIEGYDYLRKSLKEFWPYDSYAPIPFGLFLNAAKNDNLKKEAEKIDDLKKEINEWKKGKGLNVIKKRDEKKTKFYSIEDIFNDVKKMLAEQKIPLLLLDLQKLYNAENNNIIISQNGENKKSEKLKSDDDVYNNETDANGQKNVEDRNVDEIENLFIRLNSGGTPLSGEELNYSILEAQIEHELQNQIEEKCKGFFKPPRFITIAFRLFNNIADKNRSWDTDSISMRVKPKQFQRNMRDGKGEFVKFITENFIDIDHIAKTKKLLTYDKKNNPNGLPSFVSSTLADKAPEVMFMLLYRLLIKKDKIEPGRKPAVLGMITLFAWLGRGEKQRDHGKLLNNIWPCVKNLDTERFWSNETVQRAMLEDSGYEILTPFPKLKELKKLIKKLISSGKTNITNLVSAKIYDSDYGNFIKKMFFNKDIILYAQRCALSEWFHEIEDYNLDDTNRAFDWDHICPQSYIYNKRNIRSELKDWYNSNGNFRAWPYSLNRIDQNDAPSKKLNPLNQKFEKKKDEEKEIEWWKKYLKNKELNKNTLKEYLLGASFCGSEWLDLKNDLKEEIKNNDGAKQVINCILKRNYKICEEWYNQLEIDDLIPESPNPEDIKELFENIIDMRMWGKVKREEEEEGWQTYNLPFEEKGVILYFQYSTDGDTLEEDGICFGIYIEDETVGNIKISKELEDKYSQEENYIEIYFTLISYSETSVIDIFRNFNSWLKNFHDKKIKKIATERFHNSIRVQYKNEILNKN